MFAYLNDISLFFTGSMAQMSNEQREAFFAKALAAKVRRPGPSRPSKDPVGTSLGSDVSASRLKRKVSRNVESPLEETVDETLTIAAGVPTGTSSHPVTPRPVGHTPTSLWDEAFPFDEVVDSHLSHTGDVASFTDQGLESMCDQVVASSLRNGFIGRQLKLALASARVSRQEEALAAEALRLKVASQAESCSRFEHDLELLGAEKTRLLEKVRKLEKDNISVTKALKDKEKELSDQIEHQNMLCSLEFVAGFKKALNQMRVIHGDLDTSATNAFAYLDGEEQIVEDEEQAS